jgi:diguanylate cyclase (GGDEF)-like protein
MNRVPLSPPCSGGTFYRRLFRYGTGGDFFGGDQSMIRIESLMEKHVITAARSDSVLVLAEKLRTHRIGALVIVDDDFFPEGIVTERDMVRAFLKFKEQTFDKKAHEIMHSPVLGVTPGESIETAADLMAEKMVRRVPVVENNRLVGIISFEDIANALEESNAQLRAQAEELREKANRDSLTGLYNKGFLFEQLDYHIELAKRSNEAMAVLMIDIDHFKKVNDTHGHLCGDEVLRELAAIFRERMRAVNVAGRYGGEEFTIIAPMSTFQSARYMAERLRKTVEGHGFQWRGKKIRITVSIGVSLWNKHVKSGKEMIQIADDAMYDAKKGGRNRVAMGIMPVSRYPRSISS